MNAKERYKVAVKKLEELLVGHPAEAAEYDSKQLLDDIHRYPGELRRKLATLEGQIEQARREITSGKQEMGRLQSFANKVEQLEAAKADRDQAKKKIDGLQERLSNMEAKAASLDQYADVEDHTQIKVKCMECDLHFTVFTWSPDRHSSQTLHCPECGQHNGAFIIWHEAGKGFIFQNVPGKARLVEFNSGE